MENFKGSFTVVCFEEQTLEERIGLYTFKTQEGVDAFVQGRMLKLNEYAVINGPIIKKMNEPKINYPTQKEE